MTRTLAVLAALSLFALHTSTAHAFVATPGWGTGYGTSDALGNPSWGAGYSLGANVSYHPATTVAPEELSASASLSAWGRMMGSTSNLAAAYGSGYAHADGSKYTVSLYAVGLQLSNTSWSGSFSDGNSFTRTFFSASGDFVVGPVPVTATVTAMGTLGYTVYGATSPTSIRATFEPYAGASVEGSAGVGNSLASAGVYTTLDLLTVRLPASQRITTTWVTGCHVGLSYNLGLSLVLDTLDGVVGLYAKLVGAEYDLQLTQWSGVSSTIPLFAKSGTACGA